MGGREHGELVDRLMSRITELESKLYDKELNDHNFTIPAVHGASSPRCAAQSCMMPAWFDLSFCLLLSCCSCSTITTHCSSYSSNTACIKPRPAAARLPG